MCPRARRWPPPSPPASIPTSTRPPARWSPSSGSSSPTRANAAVYDELFGSYVELYRRLNRKLGLQDLADDAFLWAAAPVEPEDLPWLGCCNPARTDEAAGQDRAEVANSFIATVYFKQATSLLDRGLYAEAEAYFREVLRLWPDHAGTLNNLGTAVWRQGRIARGGGVAIAGLYALDPDDFAILNNLGNVLWDQGRLDEAVRWYRQAVRAPARFARGADELRRHAFRPG